MSNASIYGIALEHYAIQLDSFYEKYEPSPHAATIFIEQNNYMYNIGNYVNGRKVFIITSANKDSIYRSQNNHIKYVLVSPIIIPDNDRQDQVRITITPYASKRVRKHEYEMLLSDWTHVFFRFDCDTKTWQYQKTENGGI